MNTIMGGPISEAIRGRTRDVSFARGYFDGTLPREEFQRHVVERSAELEAQGLSTWQIDLLGRMPRDDHHAVEQLAALLVDAGFASPAVAWSQEFVAFRESISRDFRHLPDRFTSIFPEEGRIAYELSAAIQPRHIVVAGSYYAYLAIWLTPGLAEGGTMVCIDPDPTVCDLAQDNVARLGFDDRISVVCDDAIEVLGASDERIDLLVVDAYGSAENSDPERRGKSIYAPIVRAALPRMNQGVILAHNADRGSSALDGFYRALSSARWSTFLDTTEHLAVFVL